MSEAQSPAVPTDAEIAAAIVDNIILRYPPLTHDRNHLRIDVHDGVATIGGHVRSVNTYDYFLQALKSVGGLKDVNTTYLHVDEAIRLGLGRVMPVGVIANVEYGTVVLSGEPPAGSTVDEIVAKAGSVPGVRRVVIAFRDV